MQDHRARNFDQRDKIESQILWFYQALYAASYIPDEGLRQECIREIVEAQRFLRENPAMSARPADMPKASDLSMFKPGFTGETVDRRV